MNQTCTPWKPPPSPRRGKGRRQCASPLAAWGWTGYGAHTATHTATKGAPICAILRSASPLDLLPRSAGGGVARHDRASANRNVGPCREMHACHFFTFNFSISFFYTAAAAPPAHVGACPQSLQRGAEQRVGRCITAGWRAWRCPWRRLQAARNHHPRRRPPARPSS